MEEKPKAAAALAYDPGKDAAPRVVAAGRGELAVLIEKVARDAGVPIYRDPQLAFALTGLGLGREIPPAFYEAVAAVIAWVYQLEQRAAGR
uniref:Flagellar protein FhlB-like cytoplasmic domain-containing protein n=1 Tax=Ammonifex degensii TaxID=42838 RepID=A0A7C1J484_9THEO